MGRFFVFSLALGHALVYESNYNRCFDVGN